MPPVTVPIVQLNVLGILAASVTLVVAPLQIVCAAGVPTGAGFTVTVIVNTGPTHPPGFDVGVIKYCTVPAVVLLGLVNTWLIVPPVPALAPVMPPVIVPIVQANVLGILDVNVIFGPTPLHVVAVAPLVTTGAGLTVTVIVYGVPIQPVGVFTGVTIYCTVPAVVLLGLVKV